MMIGNNKSILFLLDSNLRPSGLVLKLERH